MENEDESSLFSSIVAAERGNLPKPIKISKAQNENDYFVFILIQVLSKAKSKVSMLLNNLPSQNINGNLRFDDPGVLKIFEYLMKNGVEIDIIFRRTGFLRTELGKSLIDSKHFRHQYTPLKTIKDCPCEFILADAKSYVLGVFGEFLVNFGSTDKAQHLKERFVEFWEEGARE